MRRSATRRSRLTCRMHCICPRISSLGLGCGSNRSTSNRAANAAAIAYVRKTLGPESFDSETVHTMDYLEYAYLQTAQDAAAKAVVDELMSFSQSAAPNLPTAYAVAAIPVRFALERRDWPAAAALSAPAIGFPLERFPWAEAMLSFARALGDARTGDIAGAQTEIAQLQSLEDKLKGKDTYWANQVEVQRLGAAGILAHVQATTKKRSSWCARRPILKRRWISTRLPPRRCFRHASCSPICCSNSTSRGQR